jgi:glycosyltransferase involved in cell wall biosynthesis
MRIAYLSTQDRGGPVDVTVTLAAALLASGEAEVRVFGPPPARGAELIAGHHEQLTVARKGDLAGARRAVAALRAWRPDVVHAQDRRAGLVAARLRFWRPVVVQTYHGVPDEVSESWLRGESSPVPPAYVMTVLAADAVVARATARTIVPSLEMGEFLRRRLRVPANRLAHLDNCVALPDSAPPRGPVRRLAFAGLLVPRKGVLILLDALAMPGVMPPDATLTIIGDGPQRTEAERAAARLPGRVTFLGFRTDVARLLTEHDALVLPSTMEQQPLVVAEAMAAGKPVVATNTGGVADMLTVPGVPTYLSPPGDVHALATNLKALFAADDAGETGRCLAAAARARFDPETCARKHLALYRELTTRTGSRRGASGEVGGGDDRVGTR